MYMESLRVNIVVDSRNRGRPQELNGPPRSGASDAAMPC